MSRSIAILFLLLFLFPLVGQMILFKLRRGQLRHELKERLEHRVPPEDLELIKLPVEWIQNPPAHFQHIKKNEVRLNGEMYDIVYRESRLDTLYYYCLADEAETILFAQLDDWVVQQSSRDPFQRGQLLQMERLLDSLFQIVSVFNITELTYSGRIKLPPYTSNYLSWNQDPVKPPPKV